MKKKKKPASHHYVDNKEFARILGPWAARQRERKKEGKPREAIPEYVGECILKICTNLGFRPNFINYPFKEEMIGDAIETSIKYIANFDTNKTNNAFSYISQIAYFSFIRRIQKEKKIQKNHLKYLFNELDLDQLADQLGDDKEHYQGYIDNMRKTLDDMGYDLTDDKKPARRKKAVAEDKDSPSVLKFMES